MIEALFPAVRSDVRRGVVYGVAMRDTVTGDGRVFLGYVGKTRQAPRHPGWPLAGALARLEQHDACQPWSDLVVEVFVIDFGEAWSDDELDRREKAYIERLQPVFNVDHNVNPDRIPPWTAKEQRAYRDAINFGVPAMPRPVPSGRVRPWRPGPARAASRRRGRVGVPSVLVPWRWRRPVRLVWLWAVLAVGLWWAAARAVPADTGAALGGFGASAVFVVAWASRGRRRRRKRRR